MRAPRADQTESIITTTTAPTDTAAFDTAALSESPDEVLEISLPWTESGRIPVQFTCKGSNISPNVAWFDVTEDAVGIAIIMYEIDDEQTVHWIVANLDPAQAFVEAGGLEGGKLPAGVVVGMNDVSSAPGPSEGYRGPCPPAGTTAAYTIEVHAIGQLIELPSGTPAQDLQSAIDFVSIQRAAVTAYAEG